MKDEALFLHLYEKQDFVALAEVTEALDSISAIRFHLIALLGLGEQRQALQVIRLKLQVLKPVLNVFLKIHLEILKLNKDLPEHGLLITAYDELPYLNQEADELIASIRMLYQKPFIQTSADQLKLWIEALKAKDIERIEAFIPQLKPIHIFQARQAIKDFLLLEGFDQTKGMLLLTLVDSRFDEVIGIQKATKLLQFNPIDTPNPFKDGTLKQLKQMLTDVIKDPSLLEISHALMVAYVLRMLPYEVDLDYYGTTAFVDVARTYLKLPVIDHGFSDDERELYEKKKQHFMTILNR
jgi:hypothetical protein